MRRGCYRNLDNQWQVDGLDVGKYTVKLEYAGYAPKTIDIDLKTDNYLGDIVLAKA